MMGNNVCFYTQKKSFSLNYPYYPFLSAALSLLIVNQFMLHRLFYPYQMEEIVCQLKGVRFNSFASFSFYCKEKYPLPTGLIQIV